MTFKILKNSSGTRYVKRINEHRVLSLSLLLQDPQWQVFSNDMIIRISGSRYIFGAAFYAKLPERLARPTLIICYEWVKGFNFNPGRSMTKQEFKQKLQAFTTDVNSLQL